MHKCEKIKNIFLVLFFLFSIFFYMFSFYTKEKVIPVSNIQNMKLIPSGDIAGIKIKTVGTMFVGLSDVLDENGNIHLPCNNLKIKEGDYIVKINDENIKSSEDLLDKINKSEGNTIKITYVNKDNIESTEEISPIYSKEDNKYHIGMWVKDGIIGVGTISFYNPATQEMYALGHGINDSLANKYLEVQEGELVECKAANIKKGKKLFPGEIQGLLNNDKLLGKIIQNTKSGIIGEYNEINTLDKYRDGIEVANINEIQKGQASILSNVGDGIKEYTVNIEKINYDGNKENKDMLIEVVDEELIEKTGGIVQGMSGSPIIQNNKIIGVVTHVLLNNPKKGYGISIENILS